MLKSPFNSDTTAVIFEREPYNFNEIRQSTIKTYLLSIAQHVHSLSVRIVPQSKRSLDGFRKGAHFVFGLFERISVEVMVLIGCDDTFFLAGYLRIEALYLGRCGQSVLQLGDTGQQTGAENFEGTVMLSAQSELYGEEIKLKG
jgi:hypothetical protein